MEGAILPYRLPEEAPGGRVIFRATLHRYVWLRGEDMTPIRTPAGDESLPRMFTRNDAMKILRLGETTLHWLTRLGKLKSVRVGGRVLIPATEIERLVAKVLLFLRRRKRLLAST